MLTGACRPGTGGPAVTGEDGMNTATMAAARPFSDGGRFAATGARSGVRAGPGVSVSGAAPGFPSGGVSPRRGRGGV